MNKKIKVVLFMLVLFTCIGFSKEEKIKLDANACNKKCIEFVKAGDFKNAIKFGEMAVELDNKNSNFQYQLGLAYQLKLDHKDTGMMAKMNYADKLLKIWVKSVELDETNMNARRGLVGFYLNAPPIAGGSIEKAEKQVKEIIKYDKLLGYTFYTNIFLKQNEFVKSKKMALIAFDFHMKLKKKNPEKRSFLTVDILNTLGYGLYNSGKKMEAIEIFKMNVQAYPNNFNPYDSLGETYMNTDETKLAIDNYEIALKLNPNKTKLEQQLYQNQKKYLKKLKSGKK